MFDVKRCVKCKNIFPITNFHKGQRYCKKCKFIADKLSRMAKIIPVDDNAQFPLTYSKMCNMCNKDKSLDAFYKSTESVDGRQRYCKDCAKQYENDRYEIQKIQRELKKQKYQTQSSFNTQGYFEALRGGKENAGRLSEELLELTPARIEFLNQQRQYWRQVFAERHNDVMKLIEAYEASPCDSLNLITDFHNNVRPNWKLQHKTLKQLKDEYFEFLRNKFGTSIIGGDNS